MALPGMSRSGGNAIRYLRAIGAHQYLERSAKRTRLNSREGHPHPSPPAPEQRTKKPAGAGVWGEAPAGLCLVHGEI